MNRTVQAFEAAQRIINKLEQADVYISNPEDIIDNPNCLPDDMHYSYGASRLVIWDDECDYVIKIARDKYSEKYNQREAKIYQAAIEEGLEESFAWCACYYDSVEWEDEYIPGIYVMEFLEGEEDDIYEHAYENGLSNYCKSHDIEHPTSETYDDYESSIDENEEIMELIESTMPQEKRGLFERFIIKQDISDVHGGNVLYRNDTVVICDYAGWGW